MRMIDRTTIIFAFAAFAIDYAVADASSAAHISPIVAPVTGFVIIAAFGWTRRGRDIFEAYVPSFFIAYCAYLGFAVYRAAQTYAPTPTPGLQGWTAMQYHGGAWPLVLFVGMFYALLAATLIALPISMIRKNERRSDPAADVRMADFLRDATRR
jgi:hypothetical protein